jgi:hypothetical protein
MPSSSRSLALGSFAFLAATGLPLSLPNVRPAPFIECGSAVSGKAGVVVVHLLDRAKPPSGNLMVEGSILPPRGVEWAGKGTIRIETNAGGHKSSCQSTAPSAFHLRSTAGHLSGTTLRVLAVDPVLVEIQDTHGRVLGSHTVDPARSGTATIGW